MSNSQPSHDYPYLSDDDLPAKRPKVFRACAQCVSAKTRCEDVKLKGCSICRRKRKQCSLAGAVTTLPEYEGEGSRRSSVNPPARALGTGDAPWKGQDAEYRMADSERRIADLERELNELRRNIATTQSIAGTTANESPLDPPTVRGTHYAHLVQLTHFAQIEDFSEALFALSTPDSWPSLLRVLKTQEIDLAFQSFKHRFSTLLPLSPFLSITTPSPTHPFVILAILHHVPTYATPKLTQLVDECIMTALSGNISFDVVLAFLILSLAPTLPGTKMDRPSPLRLISLAYQIGRDLGLDGKVEGYLVRGSDLVLPFWAESMWVVQVWTAVVNRYILLHLMQGHGRPLPASPAPLIPTSPDSNVQHSTNHLMNENRLGQLAHEAMRPLMAVEAGQHDFEEVKKGMQVFQAGLEALVSWEPTDGVSHLLTVEKRCLEYIAVSRLSFLFQRIPSPLQPIRQTLLNGMSIFVTTAQRFLGTIFPDDVPSAIQHAVTQATWGRDPPPSQDNSPLSINLPSNRLTGPLGTSNHSVGGHEPTYPAHVSMCALLAVLALRGTAAHMRWREEKGSTLWLHLPRIRRAESHLRSLGGKMAILLDQADEPFGTLEEMVAWLEPQDTDQARLHARVDYPPAVLPPSQSIPLLPFDNGLGWGQTDNTIDGTGLFDFDLFSWDPDFLAPDWMPGAALQSGAAAAGVNGYTSGSGMDLADGRTGGNYGVEVPGLVSTPEQEGWRNALR